MKKTKNKFRQPRATAEATKDTRFAGTFEVHVPVPGRIKPHRIAQQFASLKAAEDWIHSPEGEEAIDDFLASQKAG
jgi:hypothetical protein